jgi:hypothetical protein
MNRDILKKKVNELLDAIEAKNALEKQELQLRLEILENIAPHGLSVERAKVKRRGSRCYHIRNWKKLQTILERDHGFTAEDVNSLMKHCREKTHTVPTLEIKPKEDAKSRKINSKKGA